MEDVQDYTILDLWDAPSKPTLNRSGGNTLSSKKKCLKSIPPASPLMSYCKILDTLLDSLICSLRMSRLDKDTELINYSPSGWRPNLRRES